MFKRLKQRKGQSTFEYAILIVIIIGALLAMQHYIKRGVQDRWRTSTNSISDSQFSPGNTNVTRTTAVNVTTTDTNTAGLISSVIVGNETTAITEDMDVINGNFEFWGAATP